MTEKPRIIVVEDEEDMVELYTRAFRSQGYGVDTAANGSEADFKVRKFVYHAIISDLNMPYINGIEFIKSIRESQTNRKTPIVVVSGRLSKNVIMQLATMHVAKIFTKPVRMKEFIPYISELVLYKGGDLDKLSEITNSPEPAAQAAAEAEKKAAAVEEDPDEMEVK